jgi:hypothetical protein
MVTEMTEGLLQGNNVKMHSNCMYPTGVSVAGVDTVGRPGFASGTDVAPDCARLSCARTLNMKSERESCRSQQRHESAEHADDCYAQLAFSDS